MNSLTTLDLNWTGRPRSIASALLRHESVNALIDPGPASTLPTLREQLALHRLTISDLDLIFLTHIHLDHAGATGSLVRENPKLRVLVHVRGAKHMIDPSALLQSAGRLYGNELHRLFGECLPVPEPNVNVLQDGENLPLGSSTLSVLYTPGHASHHVTYFEQMEGIAFVGDTAGICVEGHPFALPATPPPDIDLELWSTSLEAIERLKPRKLFLTHFGLSPNPARHLASYRTRLRFWGEISARILSSGLGGSEALEEFVRHASAEAEPFLTPEEFQHYRYSGQLPLSWLGLSRYHRKRTVMHVSQG